MAGVCAANPMLTELIVVDNASTDDTAETVKSCRLPNMTTRLVYEPRRGQCYARNTGIAVARGEVVLFTDDDIRFPDNWIAGMSEPILSGRADAVVGGVRIAPHLERCWMESTHRTWLAGTQDINPKQPERMVGASMAFARQVLDKVPQFDTELGPGRLAFLTKLSLAGSLKSPVTGSQARLIPP